MNIEKWNDVNEWEGYYQISNFGNVRSINREIFNKGNNSICRRKGKILKPNKNKNGYLYVGFSKAGNKAIKSLYIHRLVACHFCEGYQEGYEVNHKDGNRTNNNYENLEWCSKSYNTRDTYIRNGGRYGEKGSYSKLKNEYVPIIITLYDSGVSQKIISKSFNVSQASISNVIRNITFKSGLIDKGEAIDVNTLKINPYK